MVQPSFPSARRKFHLFLTCFQHNLEIAPISFGLSVHLHASMTNGWARFQCTNVPVLGAFPTC